MEARRLCKDVDPKDAPFDALTLHLDGRLWTGDAELIAGLRPKASTGSSGSKRGNREGTSFV